MNLPHSCKRDDWKGVPLIISDPSLSGKKLAIIAYSARAINYVAKCIGLETLVFDCFADMDLRRSANEFIHVNLEEFRNPEGNLENSAAFYLNEVVQSQLEKFQKLDYVLTGSSFENDISAWNNVSKLPHYKGNQPRLAMKARNPNELYPFLQTHQINFPKTIILEMSKKALKFQFYSPEENLAEKSIQLSASNLDQILTVIKRYLRYPFVLKSANSGGGLGIFLINNRQDFLESFKSLQNLRTPPYLIQEYIQGIPMSCSFIANGSKAKIHTFSRQLIGDSRFGCKGRFTYCGNIMNDAISNPLHENNAKISPVLEKIVQELTQFGNLRGSNGIDFHLIQHGRTYSVYFIELNPRFQGTIDLVLASTGENIVQHHINSIDKQKLPDDVCFPENKTYLKSIYYSPLDFHIMVDLQGLEFRDVPLIGSFIHQNAPICSNIVIGNDLDDAYNKSFDDRDLMVRVLGLKSRIPDTEDILKRE
jgi:predicted ATP-grasp superfamily ATP-dependent carboligase